MKPKYNYIIITIAIFTTYAVFGLADSARGPAIPRIQAEMNLTEVQIGLLLTMNCVGYLIACSYSAALAKKIGMKTCLIAALLIIAGAGILLKLSFNYTTLVTAFFVLNLGFGMLEISLSVISAITFTNNTGAMMNLAHFFYGAGAVFSPIVATNLMAVHSVGNISGWRYMYLIILSSAIIPIIPALLGRLKKPDSDKKKTGYIALLKKPALWLSVMILSFSVICEIGTVAWLANFLEKAYSFSGEKAALQLTLFFVCYTLSRLVLGRVIDKIGLLNTLIIVTAFTGSAITTGVLCGQAGSTLLVISGIGIAPIFPTVMAVTAKLFPNEVDLAMTAIITIMGIFIVPANLLIGGIIQQTSKIFAGIYGEAGMSYAYAAGYLFLGICSFVAFTFALLLRKRQKKAGQLV